MKNLWFRLGEFVRYQARAQSKYYLHSPFVFRFQQNVLEGQHPSSLAPLRVLRRSLVNSNQKIQVDDFGTRPSSMRSIAGIEKQAAVSEKYGLLLYRLVHYFQPSVIIELGGSLGISSACMALAKTDATIYSLEGSPALSTLAKQHHASLHLNNIIHITGNFDQSLPLLLHKLNKADLVFFDGNHTGEATLRYFNLCLEKSHPHAVFIFDDIYLSPDMKSAWQKIKAHPNVTLTLDLYQFGICFFRNDRAEKEHFVLRY